MALDILAGMLLSLSNPLLNFFLKLLLAQFLFAFFDMKLSDEM